MIVVRPATVSDAEHLGRNLRMEDEREVRTASGMPGEQRVPLIHAASRQSYAVVRVVNGKDDRAPCAIFGVHMDLMDPMLGVVWMLCTEEIRKCALSVIRESGEWLDRMTEAYPCGLHVYADTRNSLHLRWCHMAGFEFGSELRIRGQRFVHIFRPRSVAQCAIQ